MRSSQAAFDLIVAEEVSSEATYTRKYRRPEWPGASSGATVGIGYDLGQTPKATVIADWKGQVSDEMLAAMVSACGATGAAGKAACARIRNRVDIPWDVARRVHESSVVPRWEAKVASALPNTDKLSPDSFGALLSLTFNRGPSFNMKGDRYREMRAIKAHMAAEAFGKIPDEFRSMKRLWPNMVGLRRRRDAEANLFERGLKAAAPAVATDGPVVQGDPQLWHVQNRLKALNYRPGDLDGKWGGITGGAITAFINDRRLKISAPTSMAMFRAIHDALTADISKAEGEGFTRPISAERAEATPNELAPKIPEIKAAQKASFWSKVQGWWSAAFGGVTAGGLVTNLMSAKETVDPVKSWFGETVPYALGAVFVAAVIVIAIVLTRKASGAANNAADEATKAYQEGARV